MNRHGEEGEEGEEWRKREGGGDIEVGWKGGREKKGRRERPFLILIRL